MKVVFSVEAWKDYLAWRDQAPDVADRIDQVLQGTFRTPFSGIGQPEPLKGALSGFWARRITQEHRLVYRVCDAAPAPRIEVASCRKRY